ncbi:MAG: hypothetical protein IPN76_15930 [Saprospiraceae bacterium]|nr:hypothetical protein [Saprospiraceae bacterium]
MMNTILLPILMLFSLNWTKPADETRAFKILHKGEVIGELRSVKSKDGDKTTYQNTTNIQTRIVTEVRVKFDIQAVYIGKLLESSKVDITLNGKPYASTATKRLGNGYQFFKDGKLKSSVKGDIIYSSARMMFDEPKGILNAYSEEKGAFHNIETAVANTYEKLNSRGRKTIYRYQDKALEQVEMDLGLTEIEMVAKE